MVEEYKSNQLDNQKKTPNTTEGNEFPKIAKFLEEDIIKQNKEKIENFLNKEENKKFKEGLEKFLLTEEDILRLNEYKTKLSQAKDELTIKSIIAEIIPGGYKVGDSKPAENQDWNFDSDLGQAEKEEVKAEKEEVKAEKEEVKAEKEEVKAEKKEENVESIKAMNKAIQAREELKKTHHDLEVNTGPGTPLYENTKKQLEDQGIISKLKQDNHDDTFINNYILVQATLQEVNNNSEYSQEEISTFDKIVKNLENSCNIADTKLSSFSDENISQTRTELFHDEIGNQSLIEAKKNNMKSDSHEKAYAEIFPQMEDEEMFKKYGKFLEGDSKLFLLQYQTNPDIKSKIEDAKNNPTEENKQLLESYNRMYAEILKIKDDCDTKTRDMIEELCIISQIKGMYMCMGKGDNFDLNKSNEIRYDEEGAMILDGHIDGINFSIRQDINDPEARLQTSQKLAKSEDGNTFRFGGKDNFVKSNFVLPTQNEVFSSITETVKSDKSLEGSSNQDDYLEDLQSNIMGKMEKKYEKTQYVHHYMQEQVKGEKIVEGTLGLMKEKIPSIGNNKTLIENINQSSNKDLYDFTKILKFNIDNSTDYEKDKLNQCISKILEITNNYGSNNGTEKFDSFNYPPIIENYLKNQNWVDGGSENSRLSSLSELLRHYSENSKDTRSNSEGSEGQSSKMIINDLYKDLFESVNNESLVSKERTANEETKKADNVLDSALAGFPPSPKAPGNEMA